VAVSGMSSGSLTPPATAAGATSPSSGSSDLAAALRAAPTLRGGAPAAPAGAPQDPSPAAPGAPAGTPGAPQSNAAAAATAAEAAATAGTAPLALPSFGQTLANTQSATTPLKSPGSGPRAAKPKATHTTAAAAEGTASTASAPVPPAQLLAAGNPVSQAPAADLDPSAGPAPQDATPEAAAIAPAALAATRAAIAFNAPRTAAAPVTSTGPNASPDDESDAASDTDGGNSVTAFTLSVRAALPHTLSVAVRTSTDDQANTTGDDASDAGTASLSDTGSALGAAGGASATPTDSASQANATAAAQNGATATAQIHSAVGSSAWANELGARLHWMAGQGITNASLRLTPEQLGPVEVKISVHQNAASVWFNAAQPETRAALEQALPRLKDLFSAQGMNLAQAGVSDQSARGAERQPRATLTARTSAARETVTAAVTSLSLTHQGLIDTYA
jgi:flagellar hook-length control protein FliK